VVASVKAEKTLCPFRCDLRIAAGASQTASPSWRATRIDPVAILRRG
jgi:hypothetical protein